MARDRDTGIAKKTPLIVDEQTKAAGMRAAATDSAAAARTIAKTPEQLAVDRINTQIAKSQASVSNLETIATELAAINPAMMTKATGETNSQFLARKQAAEKLARQNAMAENPLLNKAVKPTDAPPGKYYAWIGGTDTGSWQLYDIPGYGITSSATIDTSANNSTLNNTATTDTNITLVSTETDEYGNVVGVYSDSSTKILIPSGKKYKSTVDEDAYSILESTFKDFGLEELVPEIKKFMEAGLGSNQAAVELRKTQAYTTRFKGNEVRRAAGLNVLSEAEYLALEDSYSETLRAYGLQNYFGIDRKIKTASMADIIGNDISAIEFKDRIDTVVTRVNNADPTIKNTLNAFYNITDTDLVKYFLNPKENLPKLQEKVTAAEIGSAALSQGLVTDVARATALAQLGVTKEKAREGYEAISGALPTTTKLSQIYGEEGINYNQATAEQEVFGQLESAKRKRLKLAEKEVGSFSGAAGLARNALSNNNRSAF